MFVPYIRNHCLDTVLKKKDFEYDMITKKVNNDVYA